METPTGPATELPTSRTRRSWGLTMAAIGCWFIGSHVVVLVPIVILYMLVSLCLEEGWADILLIRPGILMMVMALMSVGSTVAWMLAGWDFFRSRSRRGVILVGLAMGSGLLVVVVFFFL